MPYIERNGEPVAGFKAKGPSAEAARRIANSKMLTERLRTIISMVREQRMTADEIAARLNQHVLAVRPMVSVLRKQGWLTDSGERRPSLLGNTSTVWMMVPDMEVLWMQSK